MAAGCDSFSARNLWVKSVHSQRSIGSKRFLFLFIYLFFPKEISVNEVDKFLSVRTVHMFTLWLLWGETVFFFCFFYHWQILHQHPLPSSSLRYFKHFLLPFGKLVPSKGVWLKPQVKHHYLGHGFHGGHWRDKRWEHVFLMQTALI